MADAAHFTAWAWAWAAAAGGGVPAHHQARRFPTHRHGQLVPLQCRGGWSKQIELREMTTVVQASHRPLLPATRNKVEPLSSRRSACRNPQESMTSTAAEQCSSTARFVARYAAARCSVKHPFGNFKAVGL